MGKLEFLCKHVSLDKTSVRCLNHQWTQWKKAPEEMGKGEVLVKLGEDYKEWLTTAITKNQRGLEDGLCSGWPLFWINICISWADQPSVSAEWINQLLSVECINPMCSSLSLNYSKECKCLPVSTLYRPVVKFLFHVSQLYITIATHF